MEADRKGWFLTYPEFSISDFEIAAGFYSDPTKMIFLSAVVIIMMLTNILPPPILNALFKRQDPALDA